MVYIPITDVGRFGIVKDVEERELPPEAWTEGNNVSFRDGKVGRFEGYTEILDPPSVNPAFIIGVYASTEFYWLYTGLSKAYVENAGVHTNVTNAGGDYTTSNARDWNGGLLQGIPVLTNGADNPQTWTGLVPSSALVDLPNWPSNFLCKIIRPFGPYLFALNITDASTVYPHRLRWSHPADPGTIPSSWDITDATRDAGEVDLTDVDSGQIREALKLGNSLVIYKDESTWVSRFIGGNDVFNFSDPLTVSGILAPRCATNVTLRRKSSVHFVKTGDDLIVFDGQVAESIIDRKLRRFINNDIDSTNYLNAFCFTDVNNQEAFFCYPTSGSTYPDKAVVWNYKDGTTTIRDFAGIARAIGPVEAVAAGTWDADSGIWDTDPDPWGTFNRRQVLIADFSGDKFYRFAAGNTFNGSVISSSVERTGLALLGRDRQGRFIVDYEKRKLGKRIWPQITGGPVSVQLGAQEEEGGTVTWQPAQTFTPDTDQKYLDFTANGRLLAVRITSTNDWQMSGYGIEVEDLGLL